MNARHTTVHYFHIPHWYRHIIWLKLFHGGRHLRWLRKGVNIQCVCVYIYIYICVCVCVCIAYVCVYYLNVVLKNISKSHKNQIFAHKSLSIWLRASGLRCVVSFFVGVKLN